MTTRADYRHFERLRVRWAEIDLQGIVFNGHYLMYFDTAVAGYWRAMALPYQETMHYLDGDLYVRKSTLEYEGSARYDDLIDVGVRTQRIGNSSMVLGCAVFRGDQLLVSGELVYVFADPATMSSRPVPQQLRDLLEGFEAGKPMVDVRVGSWQALGAEAGAIRSTVFVQEQKIPAEMEWDSADAVAVHAVACNRLGRPLATGRLLEHVPGVAKIGRMAVLAPMRGTRIGRSVLDALMQAARSRGDREVILHAQTSAAGFYARAGFAPRGPEFEEAGIPHIEMVRQL
ncbi:YbgC/FadM family acyl-CoA thioesterase [Aquabacterium sp. OR-4]|uniref:YbgC/FadM family acyl-CoA thioesterase n=1 Tax=Aquabacterium sp. OR-4 TaxID=2978127 RepID=UPI0021B171AF|nr:YbgC/FadM family acyl-CoA thioesterase [Aquabacterium sp. OR-4]MDT7834666.1 YbgC/FadM family acyl-CoA thioesterase [Aquabacterium sp. OR-4]